MKKHIVFGAQLPGDPHKKLEETYHIDLPEKEVRSQKELESALAAKEAHAVITLLSHKVDEVFLERFPKLEIVSNYAVGYNNIDIEAATRLGVVVTNTPDVLTETTADLAWALLMSSARRIVEADAFTRAGSFNGWKPSLFLGHDIWGKNLGIIGFGRIGRAVAKRAQGFGMKVLYHDPTVSKESLEGGMPISRVSLDTLLKRADFVSIHCPLIPATRHLISAPEIAQMKPSAILINTARGPIVDEKALVKSLKNKTIAGAGLDVYEREPEVNQELLDLPQVVLAPHIGSGSAETRAKMAHISVDAVVSLFSNKRPAHVVNQEAWENRA